ncbi:MAG: hypothetical protein JO210_10245, partial [Acidobacteriaceae bacterium]|nr:hypothetical protein [Acidobacteriaceae bacterium]
MEPRVLPPSTRELNLLLEWPGGRTRPQWVAIFSASIVFHIIVFWSAMTIPSLIGQRQPEQIVVVRHIRLYLPPDIMTQKAPNRNKVTKQIDLASLMASQKASPSRARSRPSVRRVEIPKQTPHQELAKNAPPQILPEAPLTRNDTNAVHGAGSPGGLPASAPPPPTPTPGPFQNIGSEV